MGIKRPVPLSQCLDSSPNSASISSFLPMWEAAEKKGSTLRSLPPLQEIQTEFGLLVSTWSRPNYCGHLGTEPMNARYLFLYITNRMEVCSEKKKKYGCKRPSLGLLGIASPWFPLLLSFYRPHPGSLWKNQQQHLEACWSVLLSELSDNGHLAMWLDYISWVTLTSSRPKAPVCFNANIPLQPSPSQPNKNSLDFGTILRAYHRHKA